MGWLQGVEMTQQARIRRLQDTLSATGIGVIAFGAWPLAKMMLFFLVFNEEKQRELFQISSDLPMEAFYVAFVIVAVFSMLVNLFIGISARVEGHGKKKGPVYLVVAALVAIASVASIVLVVLGLSSAPSLFDLIMSVVIDMTLIVMLVLMIFCAARLRSLNRLEE